MNRNKTNRSQWHLLGLTILLCMTFLVIATGVTYARYKSEREEQVTIQVKPGSQISLGVIKIAADSDESTDSTGVFDPTSKPKWVEDGDTYRLELTVANGTSSEEHSKIDQKMTLRLVGSLGLWDGDQAADIYLRVPDQSQNSGYAEIRGAVAAIEPGTALYQVHGAGWIYTFQNTEDEEMFWVLSGEEFSMVHLAVVMKGAVLSNPSLLQPRIEAAYISE